jgi:protease-4
LWPNGRVYTGRQAVAEKLVDEVGGEDKAVDWIKKEKNLGAGIEVIDWDANRFTDRSGLGFRLAVDILNAVGLGDLVAAARVQKLDGLLSVWHPPRN